MNQAYTIFLQASPAITSAGAVSAEWVLVGVATLATILAGIMLNDIRSSIKTLITKQGEHDVTLGKHEEKITTQGSTIEKLQEAMEPRKLASDIAVELRALTPKVKYQPNQ